MSPDRWRDLAPCAEIGWEIFFPAARYTGTYREPSRICAQCPVTWQCLAAALVEERDYYGQRYGMRGGLTPTQRAALTEEQQAYTVARAARSIAAEVPA